LKKCKPAQPLGPVQGRTDLGHRQRRRVRREHHVVVESLLEAGEQLALDGEVLDHRLDDDVRPDHRGGVRIDGVDARGGGLGLGGLQAALLGQPRDVPPRGAYGLVDGVGACVGEPYAAPRDGEHLGDPPTHRTRPDDPDRQRLTLPVGGRGPDHGRTLPRVLTIHAAPMVLPIVADPVPAGAVAVAGDRIVAVGPRATLLAELPHARVRTWPGVLLPGLVNAHTHLQYTDFADLATSKLPFFEWIQTLSARRRTFTDGCGRSRHGVGSMHCFVRARPRWPTSSPTARRSRPSPAPGWVGCPTSRPQAPTTRSGRRTTAPRS
jgi:hypothetical protein